MTTAIASRVSLSMVSAAALLACGLTGCASFNARPVPVHDAATVIKQADAYTLTTAFSDWKANIAQAGLQREGRDRYVVLQMRAIDARYQRFLIDLASQSRGTNLGLDLVTLGLTGGASFAAERAAHILSAGATAVVGGRSAFNKTLFYERTVAALIDEMNAARTRARGALSAGLAKPSDQYTLAMAQIDLDAYEEAASLDAALQQITSSAAQHADIEEARYVAEFRGCLPKPEVYVPRGKMTAYLNAQAAAAAVPATRNAATTKLTTIAGNLGLPITDNSPAALNDAIRTYISKKVCDAATAKAIADAWDPAILN